MFHRKRTAVVASAALAFLSASNALAVQRTWLASGGGTFQTAANWSGSSVPGAADTAVFDASGSSTGYTVNFTGSVVNDALDCDDNGTLNLTGVSYLLNNIVNALNIGTSGETNRTLTVSGGTLSSSGDIRIASTSGVGSGLAVPSGTL